MKKKFINAIIIIILIAIIIFSYMLPRELSKYNNNKYLNNINEIEYDNKNENIDELEYDKKIEILLNLYKKGNVYYSNDKNIQITTNDSILQKNEMKLDQIVTYISTQIKEVFKNPSDIIYKVDYSKGIIESKYIRLVNKTEDKKYMALWDITFKITDSNYLNVVIDSISGKIYGIMFYTDTLDFTGFKNNYKTIYLDYLSYLNLNYFIKDLEQEKDEILKYGENNSNFYKINSIINMASNFNFIKISIFNML